MSSESEEILQNSSEDQSCGDYFELIKTRNDLENECIRKLDQIQDFEFEKKEISEVEAAMKFKNVYEEYISELAEKLDFFGVITEDLLEEFRHRREILQITEKTICVQQKVMKAVEHEKAEKESKLNKQIEKIEMKFISKCDQLFDIKKECEEMEKELENSQKIERELELDVEHANFELYRYLCKLKSQQESIENSECPKVTQAMIDNLENENEKLNEIMKDQEKSVRTLQDEIREVDEEIKSVRFQTLRQYRIMKEHSDWKNERMTRDIADLEEAIKECSMLNNTEDPEMKKLTNSLELIRLDCLAAERCLNELKIQVAELEREPIFNCKKFEPEELPVDCPKNDEVEFTEDEKLKIESPDQIEENENEPSIFGRDYLGSCFVKLQEDEEQDVKPHILEEIEHPTVLFGLDHLGSRFVKLPEDLIESET